MSRSRKPTSIYDAVIEIACASSQCRHKFNVEPRRLVKDKRATCPRCRDVRYFDDIEILELRSGNFANLAAALKAMRGEEPEQGR